MSAETDAEAKANPDTESVSTRGDASDQQAQAEDPWKKELEAKNREIIDLKVRHASNQSNLRSLQPMPSLAAHAIPSSPLTNLFSLSGQIPPFRGRLPQPAGAYET